MSLLVVRNMDRVLAGKSVGFTFQGWFKTELRLISGGQFKS